MILTFKIYCLVLSSLNNTVCNQSIIIFHSSISTVLLVIVTSNTYGNLPRYTEKIRLKSNQSFKECSRRYVNNVLFSISQVLLNSSKFIQIDDRLIVFQMSGKKLLKGIILLFY